VAEAFEAGASGIEEREAEEGAGLIELWIYVPQPQAGAVCAALGRIGSDAAGAGLRILGREAAPDVADDGAGAPALVVEPGQAFGTGGHASTRLALALLDGLGAEALRGARVLDVGTGSGVLALAALRLGAERAVAFDLDPVAVREARANAARNGLAGRAQLFAGPITALRAPPFDLALANLLRRELLPIARALADALRPGGRALLAGLLAGEREEVCSALAGVGLSLETSLEQPDPTGDVWLGLVMRR
jgi:ribosomal protein L11 methylase PrmA